MIIDVQIDDDQRDKSSCGSSWTWNEWKEWIEMIVFTDFLEDEDDVID